MALNNLITTISAKQVITMKTILVAILLTCLIFEVYSQEDLRIHLRHVDIFPVDKDSTFHGRVYGYKSCGGPGKVLDWRVRNCNSTSICQYPAEIYRHTELDFIPSEDIEELGIRFHILADQKVRKVFERKIRESEVDEGTRYRVSVDGLPPKAYKGERIMFYYVIYRVIDNSIETCVQAEFDIV